MNATDLAAQDMAHFLAAIRDELTDLTRAVSHLDDTLGDCLEALVEATVARTRRPG
jgi:hypothetical protein